MRVQTESDMAADAVGGCILRAGCLVTLGLIPLGAALLVQTWTQITVLAIVVFVVVAVPLVKFLRSV